MTCPFDEFLKYLVYTDKPPASIAALEANIKRLVGEILAEVCKKVARH